MTTAAAGVGSWIERRARRDPGRIALIQGRVRRSYGALASRVRRLANGLTELGVTRGDRVVWLGANHPAFLELLFATGTLGAVLAPINHRLAPAMIDALVRDYGAHVAVVDSASASVPLELRARIIVGNDFEALISRSSDAPVHATPDITPADLCLLPHTSGTTGAPKGIMLTHGNVTWNAINLLSVIDLREDDITIAIAPFFRTGGTGVNVLPLLFKGGTVVIPDASSPDDLLRLIAQHRVTIGFGNPDLLDGIAHSPRWADTDLSSVRLFMTGGAPVPERLLRAYLERGVTFQQGYGLSEAAPVALLLDARHAFSKLGSAGKPPLFVDARVVGPDGRDCGPNETGQLSVRGPNVMAGYWNRPELTREVLDDNGWLSTGDAARIDVDGFAWIVDRMRDGYPTSGGVVYPGDVERTLAMHPGIIDAGVVGDGAGRGHAFVVLATGACVSEADLLELCRAHLPLHAVPIAIQFVASLPRSSVGKLLRHELKVASVTK